jgi:ATP-dependent exoDNAse (exonuclease V) beta subunit
VQQRLADALDEAACAASGAALLRQRILAQYPVALVDEFQDTSPLQLSHLRPALRHLGTTTRRARCC